MGDPPSLPERKVLRAFRIPPLALLMTVLALAVGELACGTGLYFVTMMMIAMLSIGVTYNLLGGLSTFSGLMFAGFALRTIVISQFAKVLLFEAADRNLAVPGLTITIYAVFYCSAMIGAVLFGRFRLHLPRPVEPKTQSESRSLYFLAMPVGVIASIGLETFQSTYGQETQYTWARNVDLALSGLLLFSLVLAIDGRIQKTIGRHSLSLTALIPSAALAFTGFIDGTRTKIILPVLVWIVACKLRNFRFRLRHYVGAALAVIVFIFFISPLQLYSRGFLETGDFEERMVVAFDILMDHSNPAQLWAMQVARDETIGENPEQYYDSQNATILNRESLIRSDSNIFRACAQGFHYGVRGIKTDLLINVPAVLYPDKPKEDSNTYVGAVSGLSPEGTVKTAFSTIGDSFGAFGWLGVIIVPMFVLPFVFVIFDSAFDLRRPWGTVALGFILAGSVEMTVGIWLASSIRVPLYFIGLSYLLGWLTLCIPAHRSDGRVAEGWSA